MFDDVLEVHSTVYIESLPDVTAYYSSSETEIANALNVLQCDAWSVVLTTSGNGTYLVLCCKRTRLVDDKVLHHGGGVVTAKETEESARGKYHEILSRAAGSQSPVHGAALLNWDGFELAHEYYEHTPEPTPEPEAEQPTE